MTAPLAALAATARVDDLARGATPLHRLDPRAKIVATAVFLGCVVSFERHEVAALLPFALFPVVLAAGGRVPFGWLAARVLAVAPFAVAVGLFNPLLEHEPALALGAFEVSRGWLSFASILVRFALTVGAALALVAITGVDALCTGAERLGVPPAVTTQLRLLYRYLFVLGDEALRLARARRLRSFGRRGLGIRVHASLLGHLMLRALARARRLHAAMRCRGFGGAMPVAGKPCWGRAEHLFAGGWCALFVVLRIWDLPHLVGAIATGHIG